MGIYFPSAGTRGCVVLPGTWIAGSQCITLDFYLLHVNVGPTIPWLPPPLCSILCEPVTPLLLCIWRNVASLNPWFTAWFSDSSGFYLFWDLVLIPSTVVRGGKIFLPMAPSWPEVEIFLSSLGRPVLLWTSLLGVPLLCAIGLGLLCVHFICFQILWFLPLSHC